MGLGTAATIAAITTKVAQAVGSFQNAKQATRLREQADKAAAAFLEKASSRIEKDFYAGLNIPVEAFENELLNNLQTTTTAVEALQEAGARELLGGVGKVSAVQAAVAEQARVAQGEKLFELEKLKAENKDAINQQMLQLEVQAEKDRARRLVDSQEARATFNQQGYQALGEAAMLGLEQTKLYQTSSEDKKLQKFLKQNNITLSEYAADPAKYAEDFRVFSLSDKEFDAEIEADLEKQQGESAETNFYATEEGQRQLGAETDMEFRRKQNEEQRAAASSLTPQMEGQINVVQSPLMQSLFPTFEETMAKYGITLPEQPKTYTTIN